MVKNQIKVIKYGFYSVMRKGRCNYELNDKMYHRDTGKINIKVP